jgi:hypothetical protein
MLSILSKLDIFGQHIHLTYEQKNIFKTPIGGFFTLLILMYTGGYFLAHGIHVFRGEIESLHVE